MNEPKKQIIAAIVTILALLLLTIVASAQNRDKHKRIIPGEAHAKDVPLRLKVAVAIHGARFARDQMIDPESFRVSSVWVTDYADYVCIEFHAKNGLGGYVQSHGAYSEGSVVSPPFDTRAIAWRIECLKDTKFSLEARERGLSNDDVEEFMEPQPGVDVTDKVKAALKADRDKE